MRKTKFVLLTIILILSSDLSIKAQKLDNPESNKKGMVTLTGRNSVQQSFCFRDAQFVEYISQNKVTNNCPDLTFNTFYQNSFSTAFTPAYSGRIVNIGSFDGVRQKYRISADIDDVAIFNSIQLTTEKDIVLVNHKSGKTLKLKETSEIYQAAEFDTIQAKDKNIYIVRFSDDVSQSFQRIVKFVVDDLEPSKSVTIKWEILFDNQNLKD